MNTLHADKLDKVDLYHYIAFASDLGWKPGYVPSSITVTPQLGNILDYYLDKASEEKFIYRQAAGCITITIIND